MKNYAFNGKILSIADDTIPKTSTIPKHPNKPWYTDDCDKAIHDRNKAHSRFNKQPTTENLSNLRIFRAKARRTCKQARRTSWRSFVSKLTSRTPMNKIWNFIRKIKGQNSKASVKHLKDGDATLTAEKEIADKLGETFAKYSSSDNYKPDFRRFKKNEEKNKLHFNSKNGENYNKPCSLEDSKYLCPRHTTPPVDLTTFIIKC